MTVTGFLETWDGAVYQLPALTDWELSYGLGEPCDAFSVGFVCTPELRQVLSDGLRFYAEHEGGRVFTGVVDEVELTASSGGMSAGVRGRSMAALLLDNEAEAAEYAGATLRYILEKHVIPYGVTDIRGGDREKAAAFSVASGSSQWKVLKEFCAFCCGVEPRFSREGTLLLSDEEGEKRVLSYDVMASRQVWRETRYGEISAVLVKNRALGTSTLVENPELIQRGGCCTRVVNVPRKTGYDRMRYTGAYQIRQSKKGKRVCELQLPMAFAAFPADTVELRWNPLEIYGTFRVTEAVCRGGESGVATELSLEAE